jgi:hypothetical protein
MDNASIKMADMVYAAFGVSEITLQEFRTHWCNEPTEERVNILIDLGHSRKEAEAMVHDSADDDGESASTPARSDIETSTKETPDSRSNRQTLSNADLEEHWEQYGKATGLTNMDSCGIARRTPEGDSESLPQLPTNEKSNLRFEPDEDLNKAVSSFLEEMAKTAAELDRIGKVAPQMNRVKHLHSKARWEVARFASEHPFYRNASLLQSPSDCEGYLEDVHQYATSKGLSPHAAELAVENARTKYEAIQEWLLAQEEQPAQSVTPGAFYIRDHVPNKGLNEEAPGIMIGETHEGGVKRKKKRKKKSKSSANKVPEMLLKHQAADGMSTTHSRGQH